MVKVGQVVARGTAIAKIDPAAAERQQRIAEQNQIAAANSVEAAEESLSDAQDAKEAAEEASASPTPTPTDGQQAQSNQGQSQSQSPEVAVSNAEASLARAKADKEQADQDVEAAQAAVDATTLKAPIAGTITAINGSVGSVTGGSSSGSGSAASGSTSGQGSGSSSTTTTTTTSGTGFVDLADLKSLQVVAAFAEADAIKIKAGQSATVTLNAEPGTAFASDSTPHGPAQGGQGSAAIGTVVSASSSQLVVKTEDGDVTVKLTGDTTYDITKQGTAADLKTGEQVVVSGQSTDGTITATTVRQGAFPGGFRSPGATPTVR
jgi:macrolide-specific efflux system membrane fusion protein